MRISDWSSDVCSSDLLPIARHDWNGAANWRAQLDALLAQDRDQAFDIKKPPLMRLALVRLAPARHCIVWTRHHLTVDGRSEEHTSELQSLMRISYAVFCLKKKTQIELISTIYNTITICTIIHVSSTNITIN